ncbi:radial spoke head 10 homolog B isoform X2 [Melanotaenia boesemani]|uniref:radial spoke head 10 homolog B isoform X2 n=1 Tax=Melanotaenia boesemani TaxID=1250792 RepID=UPI001C05CE34|nr:radial spoke head 10 homolog B isoform X2 [Melanotaenia boesemani]
MADGSAPTKSKRCNASPICYLKREEEEERGTEKPQAPGDRETTKLVRWSAHFSTPDVDHDMEKLGSDGTYHLDEVYLNIQSYEGETYEGQIHGEGIACFEGGHTYKGTFSKGLINGFGVFTLANGLKYEGEIVCNKLMGQGTYTWPDGSTYTGHVNNGIIHGIGSFKCAKTSLLYRGQWHIGKWHGKGTVYYNEDQTSWYKGDWVLNSIEGWGERRYLSGNIYSGEWRNNMRHGEGTMRWLKEGQQYVGGWKDGVQHGRGTHVWFLMRTDRSQYLQSNKYTGEFFQGQRHGEGTFYYADGAVYEGEWKNNKKHGQGKFISKDGRVFEGEFMDDQMMIPNLNGGRAPTSLGALPLSDSTVLGPNMALNIESLLKKIPKKTHATERKQVEFVVLQHVTELRSVYSFYSRLGQTPSPDNTFLLSRLQFWRLLKDCHIHQHGVTLQEIDHIINEKTSSAEILSPFTTMLLHELLSSLVIVAYHIYSKDMKSQQNLLAACLSRLMTDDILPNAKNVTGFLFKQPNFASVAKKYMKKCWEVYQTFCRVNTVCREDKTMTCRQLLWMFKDLRLLDHNFTTTRSLEIIAAECGDPNNTSSCLDLELTFLEFFEILLGCAEVKCQQVSDALEEDLALVRVDGQSTRKQPEIEAKKNIQTTSNHFQMEDGSTPREVVSQHMWTEDHKTPKSTESRHEEKDEQSSGLEAKDCEVDLGTQSVNHFFNNFFFPAFQHHQLVTKKMKKPSHEAKRDMVVHLQ